MLVEKLYYCACSCYVSSDWTHDQLYVPDYDWVRPCVLHHHSEIPHSGYPRGNKSNDLFIYSDQEKNDTLSNAKSFAV